jgi:light-independent protochlorophyllide reductase subunit B
LAQPRHSSAKWPRSPARTRSHLLDQELSRLPWYSRSVDSNYLTGKRVFIFADATHAIAAARIAAEELGFKVVGLGTYTREFAREVREEAERHGLEALITEDHLDVEAAIQEAQPELVLGTQMERHIAKRLRIGCAVISAPVHVQDFPARYSPQMGFEGANVIFDSWVHPLTMGLEEHLLGMFREDFEFSDDAVPSHLASERRSRGACRCSTTRATGGQRWLGRGCREGAQENPVLRARQGPAQHRKLRRRTRHRLHHCRNAL